MAEFPSLPIFTDALLGDTMHLTTKQFGAYMLMLIVAWRTSDCSLPDDDVFLARITRLGRRAWAVEKSVVMSFWKQGQDAKWRQGRLSDERKYVDVKRNKNVQAGYASALKRNERRSTDVPTNGQRKSNQPTPTPTPTPNISIPTTVPVPTREVGDDKNFGGIEAALDDADLDKLRGRAPGWDKHALFRAYDAYARTAGPPRDRKAGFFGWVNKYTKNKPPR